MTCHIAIHVEDQKAWVPWNPPRRWVWWNPARLGSVPCEPRRRVRKEPKRAGFASGVGFAGFAGFGSGAGFAGFGSGAGFAGFVSGAGFVGFVSGAGFAGFMSGAGFAGFASGAGFAGFASGAGLAFGFAPNLACLGLVEPSTLGFVPCEPRLPHLGSVPCEPRRWVRKEPKRAGFAFGFLQTQHTWMKKALLQVLGVGFDVGFDVGFGLSILNARFLQVLGSFAGAGFICRCWVHLQVLGSKSNPASVGFEQLLRNRTQQVLGLSSC
ncbi:hypothetical protein SLEP1_g39966 [Rubroshorea leprosula]|uniref:Uncharacterized protein n=1 Tax=Rubroshorea leprosula TaxID=152421 RepID=A0AAV5L2T5_9ROSI|nr:hypothetical protein SLEP1_g39966 [Rubroshorea leprosula]